MVLSLSKAETQAARTKEYLALRKADPKKLSELLALNCVKRGKRWLDRNARLGWWRNCVNGSRSRIHSGWSDEDVICFAFEYDARFAYNGYVLSQLVFDHFKLSHPQTMRLGFDGCWVPFLKYPEVNITDNMLDAAWSDLVTNPTEGMRAKYWHPRKLDSRYSKMSFEFKEPGFLLRFWYRLRLAFTS